MNEAFRAARTGAQVLRRHSRRHNLRERRRCLPLVARHLSSSSSIVPTTDDETNTLPSKLIDFSVSAKIEGEESQIATVKLRPGEKLRAESGAMLFMTHGVEMATDLHGASSAFSRMMTGQNVFLTDFTYTGEKGEGTVGLGTDFPSKILRLTLQDYENSTLICQRGAYLASNPSVDIQIEATKSLSAGFFGGQGFILQRISGQGDVLVKAGGTLVEKDLEEGETLRVTSGSIVAFTSTVDYDIQMMPGIKNAMFGGEGLFVTTLKGPGKIWLQGMPQDRMIAEIARRVPSGGGLGLGIPIGMGGGGGGAADGAAGEGAAEGEAADAAPESGEEMVAATDAAVDADRQATVASSGMMGAGAESPSALYGDAAPIENVQSPPSSAEEAMSTDDGVFKETTFTDDETTSTFTDETAFSDDTSFSTEEFEQPQEQGFWSEGDQTTTDVFDSGGGAEEASEGASSIFTTLWDLFTGGDD
jgi:uncharacterized protein (TIGR00266 family)